MARYAEVLFQHKLRFLALLFIPVLAAAAVGYELLSFRATSVLEVQDPSSFGANFVPVGWSSSSTPAENLSDAVTGVVAGSAFTSALTNTLETRSDIATPDHVPAIVSSVVANLKLSVNGPHLLTLSYSCHSHNVCVGVLDATVTVLESQLVSAEKGRAASISSFWTVQLKDAQARLSTAEGAVNAYNAAHPGSPVAADSTDPNAAQLYSDLQLWRGKVQEAQAGLTQADYLGSTSARLLQVGLTVAEPAHLASSRYVGDGTSIIAAALVLVAGTLIVLAVLIGTARMDHTARDPKAIERLVGVPVVATIPRLSG
jgi:hypothetical protein